MYKMAAAHLYYIRATKMAGDILLPYSYQYLKYVHFATGVNRTLTNL